MHEPRPPQMMRQYELVERVRKYNPRVDEDLLNRAYVYAMKAHGEQKRASGDPYFSHPLEVAAILTDLKLDDATIVAAVLHDTIEDTETTREEIDRLFGEQIGKLVDGLTKIEKLDLVSKQARQGENFRKLLMAVAEDVRVLLVKLADRLHNMRTIAAMPAEKQQRIAHETLEIYAPLAHRLGMQELKQQLEDLSFASLYPKRYAELDHLVATRTPEREVYLAKAIAEVQARLRELNITADVTGRGKHLWSIYEKMVQKGREFDEIFDLVAIRVIVDSVRDCYAALGVVHSLWRPIPGQFDDYIAVPKNNLYQSLHTAVVALDGRPLEVQIRTHAMHHESELGVAAHWRYKEGKRRDDSFERRAELDLEYIDRWSLWLDLKILANTGSYEYHPYFQFAVSAPIQMHEHVRDHALQSLVRRRRPSNGRP